MSLVVRPSVLPNWALCGGFRSGPSGAAANRGTDIHEIVANRIINPDYPIPEEHAEQVDFALDAYVEGVTELGMNADVFPEQPLKGAIHGLDGTTDLLLVDEFAGRAIDYDWKTGFSAREWPSLQMRAYGWSILAAYSVSEVQLWKVELDQRRIDKETITIGDIPKISEEITAVIRKAQADRPEEYQPGKHCNWCIRAVTCPAVRQEITASTDAILKPEEAHTLGPVQVGAFLDQWKDRIEFAEAVLGAVESRAHALFEVGIEVPGWSMVPGRKTRAWKDETAAALALRGMVGDAAFSAPKLKSPAQAEKVKVEGLDIKALVKSLVEEKYSKSLERTPPPDPEPEALPEPAG